MKFAVANQFFMIADQAGVDYTNVLRAIREDYPRAADLPGPGFAAGPCLFKDTMQLAAFTRDHFPLGQAAMQVNEGLPAYIVSALERRYGGLQGKTVGILGMAFKAESDDTRASLSYKLRKLLSWAGARVVCTDPYVDDDRLIDARLRPRGERRPRPRRAAQGVSRPRGRRQGRRRRLGRCSARGSACECRQRVLAGGRATHRRRSTPALVPGSAGSPAAGGACARCGGLALIAGIALAIGVAYAVANIFPVDTDCTGEPACPRTTTAPSGPPTRARCTSTRRRSPRRRLLAPIGWSAFVIGRTVFVFVGMWASTRRWSLLVFGATTGAAVLWGIDSGPPSRSSWP